MLKKWFIKNTLPRSFDGSQWNEFSPIIKILLHRLGLKSPEEAGRFLEPSLDELKDPFLFTDMKSACERITKSVDSQEKILVYGDYDVDGITGSAILAHTLKDLGANFEVYIPCRMKDGYGLSRAPLKKAIKNKVRLVITVDNGITGNSEVQFLNDHHIDVIIVDHHQKKSELPNAHSIISDIRTKDTAKEDLAACGLAFKLAWALRGSLDKVKHVMELVAVGTIADMAPLTGENRILTTFGLKRLKNTTNQGLKALLKLLNLNSNQISSHQVAFLIGPRINAAGRVGTAHDAYRLLMAENEIEAGNFAKLLDTGNRERQRLEQRALKEALIKIDAEHHFGKDPVIVVSDARWHEGIIGIMATRLVKKYHRPSFVISLKEGFGKGSGRSIPNFLLFENMTKCADLFEKFGGHNAACGLVIKEERIEEFKREINLLANQELSKDQLEPRLYADYELDFDELDQKLLDDISRLEPFGMENPKPLFITRHLRVKKAPRSLNKLAFSFWVEDIHQKKTAEAIVFRARPHIQEGDLVDILYHPSLKTWNGVNTLQLQIEDIHFSKFDRR